MESELSPEETEKLVQFQELSGIEDLGQCRRFLDRHRWNVESAIHQHLGGELEREPTPPVEPGPSRSRSSSPSRSPSPRPAATAATATGGVGMLRWAVALLWPPAEARPRGLVAWLLFLSSLPLRLALTTLQQFGGFVLSLVNPEAVARAGRGGRGLADDPAREVANFAAEYEATYGSSHPTFFIGTYSQVLNEAKKELKFVLVYLHCGDHQDTRRFCRETLSDADVVRYVDETCLFWACSVDTTEGYRVSQALRENGYPFLALVVQREWRMTVVGRFEGPAPAAALLARLRAAVADNEAFLVAARADRQERSFNRSLRQEQDEAYEQSLRADRHKAEEKRRQAELAEEEQRREEAAREAAARRQRRLARRKADAGRRVPPEPTTPTTPADVCRILVRLPAGRKLERRFHRHQHTLQDLYYFILADEASPHQFEMATSFPKRTLQWQPPPVDASDASDDDADDAVDAAPTLAEAGLGASEAILVLDLDA